MFSAISENIECNETKLALNDISIVYKDIDTSSKYYVEIDDDYEKVKVENVHEDPYKDLNDIKRRLEVLKKDIYYKEYALQINTIFNEFMKIYTQVKYKYEKLEHEITVRNIIETAILNYQQKIKGFQTAETNELQEFNRRKKSFISTIIDTIKKSHISIKWPNKPSPIDGFSINRKYGFNFNSEANYNQKDVYSDFVSTMFTTDFRTVEQLKNIKNISDLRKAVMMCGKEENDIKSKWDANYRKFIENEIKCKHYISEENGHRKVGNTLGEMSLAYYKYFTSDRMSWDLLMVDQPEDNISNSNIKQNLIKYFNFIRQDKQIIFVTHNPLLVVNLDADNVIYLKNNDGMIEVQNGCLEYEDNDTNILKVIAETMDGGKDTIERRLKVYGKNN